MGFHEGMSVIQMEPGKCPATHISGWDFMEACTSWSDSNRGDMSVIQIETWEVPSNSQDGISSGWDFMEAYQ
jgi:hypothetical protein